MPRLRRKSPVGCPSKRCNLPGYEKWSGFCGPEHREAHFESIGAGNALATFYPERR